MGTLTVLYLVLPFPIVFIVHELEVVFLEPKWTQKQREELSKKYPKCGELLKRMPILDRKGLSYVMLEELVMVLAVTVYLLEQGPLALLVWSCAILAFSVHILFHIFQSLMRKGYVPGVVTAILCLPYVAMAVKSIYLKLSVIELIVCTVIGTILMCANLQLANKIGKFFSKK